MKSALNKKFYFSPDFIFAIYLLVTQLIISANKSVVVEDISGTSGYWTWLLIAIAFLIKSFFKVKTTSSKMISNKLYFVFWLVLVVLDLIIFGLSLGKILNPTLVWRSFLVVMFFDLFFSYAYGENVIENKKNQNFRFRFLLLMAIAMMLAIPILLMGLVWK